MNYIPIWTQLIRAEYRPNISMFMPIFLMNLSISTLQSKSVQVSRNNGPCHHNSSHVFFFKDETISFVTTGNRETPEGMSKLTDCTEINAPENTLFHCRRHWIRHREMIYINLMDVGSIKSVRIYTQGNRQVKT